MPQFTLLDWTWALAFLLLMVGGAFFFYTLAAGYRGVVMGDFLQGIVAVRRRTATLSTTRGRGACNSWAANAN